MFNKDKHIVNLNQQTRVALKALDVVEDHVSRTLFVVNDENKVVGSLTDGDIRRGLLNGLEISQSISQFMNTGFKSLFDFDDNFELIKDLRKNEISLVPLVNSEFLLIDVIDLKKTFNILPVTALIMAGGKGERLKPLTDNKPKPMIIVGSKPIIEHNIDRLISYGVNEIYISVKYLKNQIIDYFGDGSKKGIKIYYIDEDVALGTIGSLSLIEKISHEDILVMNSDILTNIDFEEFYNFYKEKKLNMALVSVPYNVNIPYAVLETSGYEVSSFLEKPKYTYYSNGGIYILKFELKNLFTKGAFFNATDLMDLIIKREDLRLGHFPLLSYWLDIGKHNDLIKAQEDIKHLNL